MNRYFFVPGNKIHKIPSLSKFNIDTIIIDLEDAVKFSERAEIVAQLIAQKEALQQHFIRVPLHSSDDKMDLTILENLVHGGFTNFVFPKLETKKDVTILFDTFPDVAFKAILLVETPSLFFDAREVLLTYKKYFCGLGFGSHDIMTEIGGAHTLKNLEYPRMQMLYLAKACKVEAIDIASMELKNESILQEEIIDGFSKGFDAKLFIHPWQLEVADNAPLYTDKDQEWAQNVLEALSTVANDGEFNPRIINGQIIERPHLNKAKKIIKYFKK